MKDFYATRQVLNLKFPFLKNSPWSIRESCGITFCPGRNNIFNFFISTSRHHHLSTKMVRKRLTHSEKLIILQDVDERHAGGESLGSIARSHGIQTVQIKKWRSKIMELAATKRTKKSLSRGNQGRLGKFEEQLVG